jgi:hypothetical protein
MGNLVRHDLGYGYDPVQGHAPFGLPVLSYQLSSLHILDPPFSTSFFE